MQECQQTNHQQHIKFFRFFDAEQDYYQNQRDATHYQNEFEVNTLVGHHHQYK
jgi:hypothetical protein